MHCSLGTVARNSRDSSAVVTMCGAKLLLNSTCGCCLKRYDEIGEQSQLRAEGYLRVNLLGHIKWDDLYTQVGAGLFLLVIGWFTGLFGIIARGISGLFRQGLKISRDTSVGGWYSTRLSQSEIESVIDHPTILYPIFIKTRWWITNGYRNPAAVANAYFISEKISSHGKSRHE